MDIEEIKPGMGVGCTYRLQRCGVVLPPDAPAAWAASLAFPDIDAQNPPGAERVRAHVEWRLSQGLLRGRYPVAWSFGKVYREGVDALFPYWPATCSRCRAKIDHDDMRRGYDAGTVVCFGCYCKNGEARWDELRELVAGEVRAALESCETVVEVWGGEERHWPRCAPFVERAGTPERLAVRLVVRCAGCFTTLRFAGGKTYDEPFLPGFLGRPPRQLPADNRVAAGRRPKLRDGRPAP